MTPPDGLPPHSLEAEQSVLGALLIDAAAYDRIAGRLTAGAFYRADHAAIFATIERMAGDGVPVDVQTVCEAMQGDGPMLAYLGQIAFNTPSAANVRRYAEIVADRALERALLAACRDVEQVVQTPGESAKAKLDTAQAAFMALSESADPREPTPVSTLLPETLTAIKRRMRREGGGIPLGLPDVDKRLGGLKPGNLIYLAGRPGSGKTALALQLGINVAGAGAAVGMLSMEMGRDELMDRLIANVSGVPLDRVISGELDPDDVERLRAGAKRLETLPVVIDDTPALTIGALRAKARAIRRRHGLTLLLVDYLQLMSGQGSNRNAVIEEISRGLKSLAKELAIPVVCLSQLNRDCERRQDSRPILADLRDSGSVEQDADVVLMVYRDEMYDEHSAAKGTAELLIRKARQGKPGTVRLTFVGDLMRFGSYAGPEISNVRPIRHARGMDD